MKLIFVVQSIKYKIYTQENMIYYRWYKLFKERIAVEEDNVTRQQKSALVLFA